MKRLLLIVMLLFLAGCTPVRALIGMNKTTEQFITSSSVPELRFEPGAEALAGHIEAAARTAIDTVRQRQGAFSQPVVIYATASVNSFAAYCATPRAAACVINKRLFMAPRLLKTPERIPGIVTHELSHLQLNQHLGTWKYQTRLPAWFHEGLAVFVADGSGGEEISIEQASDAILAGQTFEPEGRGSVLFQRTAHHYDLAPHMFYRQASLFVSWMHEHDPIGFKAMLVQVEQGKFLYDAMQSAYGFDVAQAWNLFREPLRKGPA